VVLGGKGKGGDFHSIGGGKGEALEFRRRDSDERRGGLFVAEGGDPRPEEKRDHLLEDSVRADKKRRGGAFLPF